MPAFGLAGEDRALAGTRIVLGWLRRSGVFEVSRRDIHQGVKSAPSKSFQEVPAGVTGGTDPRPGPFSEASNPYRIRICIWNLRCAFAQCRNLPVSSSAKEHIQIDLERMLILEIAKLWRELNWNHFRDVMRTPAFELSETSSVLGSWNPRTRTISISRKTAFAHPWETIEEILKHEMAHQFVDEALNVREESAHGLAFRSTCGRLGIDPAASGVPVTIGIDDHGARIVEKIARLLNLAGSPNQHESEAAAVAARRLIVKHNVDCRTRPKRYAFKRLGIPTGRIEESARILSGILTGYFFVEGLWIGVYVASEMKRGRVLEIAGTPENIAIGEFVHGFLEYSAESLWIAHRTKHGVHSNRERRTFKSGVMSDPSNRHVSVRFHRHSVGRIDENFSEFCV